MFTPENDSRMQFDIFTMDFCLQSALQHLFIRCHELDALHNMKNVRIFCKRGKGDLRIALIDVRCLYLKNEMWLSIMRAIKNSDFFIFMSSSEVTLGNILHLSLKQPVSNIKRDLINMLEKRLCNRTRNHYDLMSPLNISERDLFVQMAGNVDILQVQKMTGIKNKKIYQVRAGIMRKFNINNKKEFNLILRLYDFLEYVNCRGSSIC